MNLKAKTILFVATGCRIGYSPIAPGTLGSLEGLLFCLLLAQLPLPSAALCTVLFILFSIWVSHEAEKAIGKKDPGCIVIDEVAGMMVTLLGMPFNALTAGVGFFVFRGLDILKPPPIRNIESRVSGGAGIVLDDIAAGIIGNFGLRIIFSVFEVG